MPIGAVNGIALYYEVTGDDSGAPLLLIAGTGAQLIDWDDGFCAALADEGFPVIRFDSRDTGLSTKFDGAPNSDAAAPAAMLGGEAIEPRIRRVTWPPTRLRCSTT
ncbi:MAG: alpha/beta hydrolase [Actinobacteria bacterium]|nr:alpha/beta hydrolase [Actinomycetota bacterium]